MGNNVSTAMCPRLPGPLGGVPLEHSYFFLLQLDPKRCESCYGAETPEKRCCNTCEDVREAYRRKGWALSDVDDIKQVLMGLLLDIVTCKIIYHFKLSFSFL